MVTILESKNYLNIEESQIDKRSLSIKLTSKTYQYFKENRNIGKEELNIIFSTFKEKILIF
jgi:DNA-binding MarR family transcriptional regulator